MADIMTTTALNGTTTNTIVNRRPVRQRRANAKFSDFYVGTGANSYSTDTATLLNSGDNLVSSTTQSQKPQSDTTIICSGTKEIVGQQQNGSSSPKDIAVNNDAKIITSEASPEEDVGGFVPQQQQPKQETLKEQQEPIKIIINIGEDGQKTSVIQPAATKPSKRSRGRPRKEQQEPSSVITRGEKKLKLQASSSNSDVDKNSNFDGKTNNSTTCHDSSSTTSLAVSTASSSSSSNGAAAIVDNKQQAAVHDDVDGELAKLFSSRQQQQEQQPHAKNTFDATNVVVGDNDCQNKKTVDAQIEHLKRLFDSIQLCIWQQKQQHQQLEQPPRSPPSAFFSSSPASCSSGPASSSTCTVNMVKSNFPAPASTAAVRKCFESCLTGGGGGADDDGYGSIHQWPVEKVIDHAKTLPNIMSVGELEQQLIRHEQLDGFAIMLLTKQDAYRLCTTKGYTVSTALRVWRYGQNLVVKFLNARAEMATTALLPAASKSPPPEHQATFPLDSSNIWRLLPSVLGRIKDVTVANVPSTANGTQ